MVREGGDEKVEAPSANGSSRAFTVGCAGLPGMCGTSSSASASQARISSSPRLNPETSSVTTLCKVASPSSIAISPSPTDVG